MEEIAEAQPKGFFAEEMTLSVGPQHPSTHGVLRFVVKTDGEVISEAIPDVGYLHRSIEKIGEKVTYHGYVPYTDRADYLAAMFANQAFCMAAEKLGGMAVTRRGEFCRVIACELNRIASHLISVGTFGQDIGAMTPFARSTHWNFPANRLPMIDSTTCSSPSASSPSAARQASFALVPVPHGERSYALPGQSTKFRETPPW